MIKEKNNQKLIQQSSSVSNLQLAQKMDLFFEQNSNMMKQY
jgi:hypothetical protein